VLRGEQSAHVEHVHRRAQVGRHARVVCNEADPTPAQQALVASLQHVDPW